MESFLANDIDRVSELSKQGYYDFIIVGSGVAGGILARKINETDKKVLLIERGGLDFSTHCLNTSRPHWQINSIQGPSQDNDIVYAAVKQKVQTAADSDPYAGGPVYCLGGRSNVWGLYSPAIIEKKHREFFPEKISDYLEEGGYQKAFGLFTNESQNHVHNVYPQGDLNSLEMGETEKKLNEAIVQFYKNWMHTTPHLKSYPKVQLSPMAAEFKSTKLFNFPQGAYSTVDFLLDRTFARDANLTILLNTEVLTFPTDIDAELPSVMARSSACGGIYRLFAKKIILCAGTIGTATIALNSGLQKTLPLVGKGLTDHEIWGVRFLKEKKSDEKLKDPMKWQCRMVIGDKDQPESRDALLNVAINANTFLARGFYESQLLSNYGTPLGSISPSPNKYDTINVTIECQAELSQKNEVLNVPTSQPVVYIKEVIKNKTNHENKQKEMQDLATKIRNKLLGECAESAPRLSKAGFGAVAHEVGTMRIKGPKTTKDYVVNENLQLQGFTNIYVCDLSIFPFSPPANPSLTLAAVALWLASQL